MTGKEIARLKQLDKMCQRTDSLLAKARTNLIRRWTEQNIAKHRQALRASGRAEVRYNEYARKHLFNVTTKRIA